MTENAEILGGQQGIELNSPLTVSTGKAGC